MSLSRTADAAVRSVETTPDGADVRLTAGQLRIRFVTDRIVRITATQNGDWSARPSLMRAQVTEKPGVIVQADDGKTLTLRSSRLTVALDRTTGAISYTDPSGKRLLQEAPIPRSFERIEVMKSLPDTASITKVQTVDGEREIARKYTYRKDRDAWKATAQFLFGDNEALYGLGCDETADLNLRGTTRRLYQHNLRKLIPSIISTHGYGLLFDAYSAMTFQDVAQGGSLSCDVVDDLDYYFIYGPSMDGAIAGYRQLTGAATMLPRWAFGYVQSKERYKSQEELDSTVKQFRDRQIPLDLIVQDWNYWKPNHWGSFVPDPKAYPDISAMTKAAHDLHARVMISIWPNPSPSDPPGQELRDGGYTLAGTTFVDFFQPKAGEVYFKNAWSYLGQHGIDAWWCDSTEPSGKDWVGVRPKDADRENIDELARLIDPQFLNAYALMDSRELQNNWLKAAPDKRLVNLTRSGYAGSQATGAVIWTGDISAKWSVLAQQVVAVQSFSAAGNPYITFDIGAFFVHHGRQWFWDGDYDQGVADKGYRELYTRWFQFGAFLPMFRSHGTDTPREPWQFGEPGTPFYDAIIETIRLRYRMLPYVYSQAARVHFDGASFVRPVACAFPDDIQTHNLKSQVFFGNELMVSPVLSPMYWGPKSSPIENAAKARDVYLPAGKWYDFWTGQSIDGGTTISADAPISRLPVHVRAGSILPLGPDQQYVDEKPADPIELRVYRGADGKFNLYEDEGDGRGYVNGSAATIPIEWNEASQTLRIGKRVGEFPGMLKQRTFRIVWVRPGHGIGTGNDQADAEASYVGDPVIVQGRQF